MKNIALILISGLLVSLQADARTELPVRPPDGTYIYAMDNGLGSVIFKSTIVVKGDRASFSISETTKLPNGAIATTQSTWSSTTLNPLTFDVFQGNTTIHARLTPAKVTLKGLPDSFARIPGTACILPSVGLISTDLMFAYFENAHPGESITLAEIQNNQTVLARRNASSALTRAGDTVTIDIIKQQRHGNTRDQEHIVAKLNRRSGIIGEARATPGDARIKLLHYKKARR